MAIQCLGVKMGNHFICVLMIYCGLNNNKCYPFELCYSKFRFSTDRIKQRSRVLCLLSL